MSLADLSASFPDDTGPYISDFAKQGRPNKISCFLLASLFGLLYTRAFIEASEGIRAAV